MPNQLTVSWEGTVKLTHESQPRRNFGLRGYPIYRYKIAPAGHMPGTQLLSYVLCPVWLTVP
jgi:hypothetical protein